MNNLKPMMVLIYSVVLSLWSSHALAQSSDLQVYSIDASHSSIEFSIRHFVAKTNGNFSDFQGVIKVDPENHQNNYTEASIFIKSIDTDSKKRDAHLQEPDYFNSEKSPVIEFKSTRWDETDTENIFSVKGDLSMNGITRNITLEVELLGMGPGMHGKSLSGWEGTTTIDRTQWNIMGGIGAVGESVDIRINIEAVKQ
jgi:polyisoprenoid-binding protein YceI|tara:strand:- start:1 stop:594 length:594 start_codon:yes stop_codon:yes gene_type:complete